MRIETPTDFLAIVNTGDVLYTMRSVHGKPYSVERIEVLNVVKEEAAIFGSEPLLAVYRISGRGHEGREFANDMLNRWHGVWTELDEAMAYFRERQAAYETDPELIAEYRESVEDSKRWRSYLSDFLF